MTTLTHGATVERTADTRLGVWFARIAGLFGAAGGAVPFHRG
ncbi:hypothetical protein ACFVMC_21290 [Nocardia sp. NPDC127579]